MYWNAEIYTPMYITLCNPYMYTYGNNLIPISIPAHLLYKLQSAKLLN
jgi:hypothetical protein